MSYSIELKDPIFAKSYRISSFAKNMGKHLCKKVSKSLSGKCSEKPDPAKKSATVAIKIVSENEIQKTAEATADLIDKKTVDAIAKPYNGKNTKV